MEIAQPLAVQPSSPAPVSSVASGATPFSPKDAANAERQRDLKDRIRAVCRDEGMHLREGDRYGDPRQLAALVLEDLTATIDAEFPSDQVPDVWAREAQDHEVYAQSRRSA